MAGKSQKRLECPEPWRDARIAHSLKGGLFWDFDFLSKTCDFLSKTRFRAFMRALHLVFVYERAARVAGAPPTLARDLLKQVTGQRKTCVLCASFSYTKT